MGYSCFIDNYNPIPMDPNTVWEATANPPNHTPVPLPKKVLITSIGHDYSHQKPYPLVMTNIAIENDHRNSGFSH